MHFSHLSLSVICMLGVLLILPSCSLFRNASRISQTEAQRRSERGTGEVDLAAAQKAYGSAYERYVSTRSYPKILESYVDDELMKRATASSPVYICLSQQRGRLYVDGQVAADWPVSTGVSGHPTPTGNFRVMEKDSDHVSSSYGKVYNAEGKCIDSNATPRTTVPEGGKYVGSAMPNFLRLTGDGIGIHTGRVRAGQRLSHGCIRTPNVIARKLFHLAQVGTTRVVVCQQVEDCWPLKQRQAQATVPSSASR